MRLLQKIKAHSYSATLIWIIQDSLQFLSVTDFLLRQKSLPTENQSILTEWKARNESFIEIILNYERFYQVTSQILKSTTF